MKASIKMLVSAVFVAGAVFNAAAQINIDGGTINIRSSSNPYQFTYHYGDLV